MSERHETHRTDTLLAKMDVDAEGYNWQENALEEEVKRVVEHARALERELAEITAQRDEARKALSHLSAQGEAEKMREAAARVCADMAGERHRWTYEANAPNDAAAAIRALPSHPALPGDSSPAGTVTECCGVPCQGRFCRKCGWEARLISVAPGDSSLGAEREDYEARHHFPMTGSTDGDTLANAFMNGLGWGRENFGARPALWVTAAVDYAHKALDEMAEINASSPTPPAVAPQDGGNR